MNERNEYAADVGGILNSRVLTIFPEGGGKAVARATYNRTEGADEAIKRVANAHSLEGDYVAVLAGLFGSAEETVTFSAAPAKPPVEVVF